MANLLQSSQNVQTTAPCYYTNYLQNLICKGQQAQQAAQFVGAQPLQEQAFQAAGQNFGAYTPMIQTGQALYGCAANQNITGAGSPYIQQAAGTSPLSAMQPYANQATQYTGANAAKPYYNQATQYCAASSANPYINQAASRGGLCAAAGYLARGACTNVAAAANPYLQQAAQSGGLNAANPYIQNAAQTNIQGAGNPYLQQAAATCTAQLAQQYMSPYLNTAVQNLSDIAQRNIQQNIAPQATAAAVGAGQFGSQRGAQVLGQLENQAQQCLNSQIAQMEQAGYGQAMCAAKSRQSLLGQLGATAGCLAKAQAANQLGVGQAAGTLAQQQASLLGQLGATAGCMAAKQALQALQAGQTAGTLSQQQQNLLGQLGATSGCLASKQFQNYLSAGTNLGQLQQGANQIASGLGSTAANAQNAYNQTLLGAGQSMGCLTAKQAAARMQAAQGLGGLACTAARTNIACLNALSTLGGQQQTICQNKQLFPLSTLSSLSNILNGAQIPMGTKTQMCTSPLSGILASGVGLAGLAKCYGNLKNMFGDISNMFGGSCCNSDRIEMLPCCRRPGQLPAPGEETGTLF